MEKIALKAGDLIEMCPGPPRPDNEFYRFTILEITSSENKKSWNELETIIYRTIAFSHHASVIINLSFYDSDQIRIISSPDSVDEGK